MKEVKVWVSSRVETATAFGIIFAVFSFVNAVIEIIGIWICKSSLWGFWWHFIEKRSCIAVSALRSCLRNIIWWWWCLPWWHNQRHWSERRCSFLWHKGGLATGCRTSERRSTLQKKLSMNLFFWNFVLLSLTLQDHLFTRKLFEVLDKLFLPSPVLLLGMSLLRVWVTVLSCGNICANFKLCHFESRLFYG